MPTESIYEPRWNPRYTNYARCHGHTEESMLLVDRARCGGACMMYFIFWVTEKWRQFDLLHPEYKCGDGHTEKGHCHFDAWLDTQKVYILPYPLFFALEYLDVPTP